MPRFKFYLLLGILLTTVIGCKSGNLSSYNVSPESKETNSSQFPGNTNDNPTNSSQELPGNTSDPTNPSELPGNTNDPTNPSELPGNTNDPPTKLARYVLKQDPEKRKIDILVVLNNTPSSMDSSIQTVSRRRATHFKDLLTKDLQKTDWQMAFTSFGQETDVLEVKRECIEWGEEASNSTPECPKMECLEYGDVTYTVRRETLNTTHNVYTLQGTNNQPLQVTPSMDAFKYAWGPRLPSDPTYIKILAPDLRKTYDIPLSDILTNTVTSRQFGRAGFEMAGLAALFSSDHPYLNKLRSDALLAVVFITDVDDRTTVYPNHVIEAVETKLGSSKQFSVYGITTKPNDNTCIRKFGITENQYWGVQASKVEYLTFLKGGLTVSICDDDYSSVMGKLSKAIMSRPDLTKPIELKHKNILEDTIKLYRGNIQLDPNIWSYDSKKNTITLNNPPSDNTQIQIEYSYRA